MPFNSKVIRLASELESSLQRTFATGCLDPISLLAAEREDRRDPDKQRIRQAALMREVDLAKAELAISKSSPLLLKRDGALTHCLADASVIGSRDAMTWRLYVFRDVLYDVRGPCSSREAIVLVASAADEERRQYERLHAMHFGPENEQAGNIRERISAKVRIAVWRRDDGKCATCGSRHRLEYDHIIPVCQGGGTSVRNIELLCEECNRKKGPGIQ